MKKWLAALFALVLCLSLFPAASGEETTPVITEFTLDNAKELIYEYEWEGVSGSIAQVGLRLWRVSSMERMELTEEMEESGYLAVFYSEDMRLIVLLQDYGLNLTDYQAAVEESGYENIRQETVNGREFLIYDEKRTEDSYCRVAATEETDGQILEFVFFYQDEELDTLADVIVATIREDDSQGK